MSLQDIFNEALKKNIITFMDFELYENTRNGYSSETIGILAMILNMGLRRGDSCVSLNEIADVDWGEILGCERPTGYKLPPYKQLSEEIKSNKSGVNGKLFYLYNDKLFFERVYNYELTVANILKSLSKKQKSIDIDNVNCKMCDFWQRVAVSMVKSNNLVIISGGPGTGKTTTIKSIIENIEADKKVGLCAPTGKAVSRLIESIRGVEIEPPMTLHRFLRANEKLTRFFYNENNKLPYDVVIVDEASMINIELAYRLLISLKENAKLILVGDRNQLESVETGSLLNELCSFKETEEFKTLNVFSKDFIKKGKNEIEHKAKLLESASTPIVNCSVELEKNFRFGEESGIWFLSNAIKRDDMQSIEKTVKNGKYRDLVFKDKFDASFLEDISNEYFSSIKKNAAGSFEYVKVLTPLKISLYGSIKINELIDKNLKRRFLTSKPWYVGREVIINTNDYQNGLFNGDIGVCVEENNKLSVRFTKADGDVLIAPEMLPEYELAFAMSVHKSQGSEFDVVYFVIGHQSVKTLTKELIYTAITRARKKVYIIGDKDIFIKGLKNKSRRKSALGDLLYSRC